MAIVVRACGEPFERPCDADLGQRVDRRRRLVEDQHVGTGEPGAEQRDELALARRQLVAAFADPRGEPVGQRLDPVADAEFVDDPLDISVGDVLRTGERDVGGDRVVEQERLLRHDDQPSAEFAAVDPPSGTPPRSISPMVGSANRAISRPSVVLPDPVEPTIATCCPAGIDTSMSLSTAASAPDSLRLGTRTSPRGCRSAACPRAGAIGSSAAADPPACRAPTARAAARPPRSGSGRVPR